jgi:hypothetical protein
VNTITCVCRHDGHTFTIASRRGRPPVWCDEHRPEKVTQSIQRMRVGAEVKRIDDSAMAIETVTRYREWCNAVADWASFSEEDRAERKYPSIPIVPSPNQYSLAGVSASSFLPATDYLL